MTVIEEGEMKKFHKEGLLHRAVAVVLYNKNKEILLTQRSKKKIGEGLWETVGTHVRTGESAINSGCRCLKNEIGVEGAYLRFIGNFSYFAQLGEYAENEVVDVLVGEWNDEIKPNKEEVENFKWIQLNELKKETESKNPQYALWLLKGSELFYKEFKEIASKPKPIS